MWILLPLISQKKSRHCDNTDQEKHKFKQIYIRNPITTWLIILKIDLADMSSINWILGSELHWAVSAKKHTEEQGVRGESFFLLKFMVA